jgi:hypothetical protein
MAALPPICARTLLTLAEKNGDYQRAAATLRVTEATFRK